MIAWFSSSLNNTTSDKEVMCTKQCTLGATFGSRYFCSLLERFLRSLFFAFSSFIANKPNYSSLPPSVLAKHFAFLVVWHKRTRKHAIQANTHLCLFLSMKTSWWCACRGSRSRDDVVFILDCITNRISIHSPIACHHGLHRLHQRLLCLAHRPGLFACFGYSARWCTISEAKSCLVRTFHVFAQF